MDYHALQQKLFALDPSDPREDLKKLTAMANGGVSRDVPPTKDYLNESAQVPEGSLKLDKNYSVSDFAALAGVKVSEGPLDGIRAGMQSYKSGGLAPDALQKGIGNWISGKGGSSKPTEKPKSVPATSTLHPRLVSKLEQYKTALEKIFTSERELKKEFIALMKRADPTIESVDEAEVMKFKAPNTVKQRDPNWRDMEALRKSGAAGSHKDKKKLSKQGYEKHKSKEYESIKDKLWAALKKNDV